MPAPAPHGWRSSACSLAEQSPDAVHRDDSSAWTTTTAPAAHGRQTHAAAAAATSKRSGHRRREGGGAGAKVAMAVRPPPFRFAALKMVPSRID